MKKILYILLLLLLPFNLIVGQNSQVRVKVTTSRGAEIGIDDDISSNNVMTKMLTVGEHIVTVYYGSSYKKEFNLMVTNQSEQAYEFLIDGKLSLKGLPENSNVYVNGLNMGTLPCELELLGELIVKVTNDPDYYYDAEKRFDIKPFSSNEYTFNLSKVPPPTNHLILATWKPEGYGLFYGVGKTLGGYIRGATSFGSDSAMGSYNANAYLSETTTMEYKSAESSYMLISAGLMCSIKRRLFFYVGAGYGAYDSPLVASEASQTTSYNQIISRETKGVAADCGLSLSFNVIALSVGYSRIFDQSSTFTNQSYQEVYVGLGLRLQHKHNK